MNSSILQIIIGGAIGSVLRYQFGRSISSLWNYSLPLSTLIVNTIGSLIIGILSGLVLKYPHSHGLINNLLIIGFCGGFTTFSTFSIENIKLLQNGNFLLAALYISASVILGLLFAFIGVYITK